MHVSHSYSTEVKTTALYTFIFVEANVMLIKHSGSSSPKCLVSLLILEAISLSRYASLKIILPRYLKLSMFFRQMPSMVMVGSWGLVCGAG